MIVAWSIAVLFVGVWLGYTLSYFVTVRPTMKEWGNTIEDYKELSSWYLELVALHVEDRSL